MELQEIKFWEELTWLDLTQQKETEPVTLCFLSRTQWARSASQFWKVTQQQIGNIGPSTKKPKTPKLSELQVQPSWCLEEEIIREGGFERAHKCTVTEGSGTAESRPSLPYTGPLMHAHSRCRHLCFSVSWCGQSDPDDQDAIADVVSHLGHLLGS